MYLFYFRVLCLNNRRIDCAVVTIISQKYVKILENRRATLFMEVSDYRNLKISYRVII